MKFFTPQPDRHWLTWWDSRLSNLTLDVAVVAVAWWFAFTVSDGFWVRLAFLIGVASLGVRRRFPWLPILASPLICFDHAAFFPLMVASYTVARQWGPRWRTLASVIVAVGFLGYSYWDPRPHDGVLYQLFVPSAWLAVPALAGLWMYQRRKLLDALSERAEQAERQQELLAERAVAAERRRIAREMHDVVAHRVSTIALQAGALTMTAPDERTVETAEIIRSASATALTELREILDVLRSDQQEPSESSESSDGAHGVRSDGSVSGDVATLVRDCVAAGGNIHLHAPEELPEVPGAIRRAACRVAQEALTNAAKHAPHARVDVHLAAEQGELRLTVSNRRGGGRASIPGSGYGLLGMRERVTLAQGTLQAGPTEDGGFRVHAALPLSPGDRLSPGPLPASQPSASQSREPA
ncbi:MAG: sensor histidine kinase [Nocardiopsaceae bacterium]|nr:sensor histidine kinase [Nocardiopsaceae bacterium]